MANLKVLSSNGKYIDPDSYLKRVYGKRASFGPENPIVLAMPDLVIPYTAYEIIYGIRPGAIEGSYNSFIFKAEKSEMIYYSAGD